MRDAGYGEKWQSIKRRILHRIHVFSRCCSGIRRRMLNDLMIAITNSLQYAQSDHFQQRK